MKAEALLLLLTAHILGDYYLQTKKLAEDKAKKLPLLLFHCLIYAIGALILIIPVFSTEYLWTALIFAGAHFIIDLIKWYIAKHIPKINLEDKSERKEASFKRERLFYLSDQAFHLISILLIYLLLKDYIGNSKLIVNLDDIAPDFSYSEALKIALLFLVILKPTNVTFKRCFYFFKPKDKKKQQLSAGALIGDFERVLIVILLILEQYAAIGLVFTAKSIARYNKISTEKEFAEYYLLGTLYSVLAAVIAYLAVWQGFVV